MKINTFFRIGTYCTSFILIVSTLTFQLQEKEKYNEYKSKIFSLNRDITNLQHDLHFLKKHKKDIDLLTSKGWFTPVNRLIAAEKIEELSGDLDLKYMSFAPQTKTQGLGKDQLSTTQIEIQLKSRQEDAIYQFLEDVLETFPGILVLQELTLFHEEKALVAHLIFQWISLGADDDKT